jgi:hypothetical protein
LVVAIILTETLAVTTGGVETAPLLPAAAATAPRLLVLVRELDTAEAAETSEPRPVMETSTDSDSSRLPLPPCTVSVTLAVLCTEAGRLALTASPMAVSALAFRLLTPARLSVEVTGRSVTVAVTVTSEELLTFSAAAAVAATSATEKVDRFTGSVVCVMLTT